MTTVTPNTRKSQSPYQKQNEPAAYLEFQGGLVSVRITSDEPVMAGKANVQRGSVSEFSPASRSRLLRRFARLDLTVPSVFITLTYPDAFPSPKQAKKDLRAFLERLRRFAPGCSAIWRLEFQERGAPHFHLLVFNLPFLPMLELKRWWGEIVDYANIFTRIEMVGSRRKAMGYVSKYVAKIPDPGGFNLLAYLHGKEFIHPQTGEYCGSIGRWWGTFQRDLLPFAELVRIAVETLKEVFVFRRGARHIWSGVSRKRDKGFSVFVGDAAHWLDYWFGIVTSGA